MSTDLNKTCPYCGIDHSPKIEDLKDYEFWLRKKKNIFPNKPFACGLTEVRRLVKLGLYDWRTIRHLPDHKDWVRVSRRRIKSKENRRYYLKHFFRSLD